MRKIFFLLTACGIFITGSCQNIHKTADSVDTWKIEHNGKIWLETGEENATKNVIALPAAELQKPGNLLVEYTQAAEQTGWKRTLTAYDDKDHELMSQSGAPLKIPNEQLQAILKESPFIKIYTYAKPEDPKTAEAVRIRRVHLCTLSLEQ